MDKNKNKRSILESSNNTISGYSIEYSDITHKGTLEERIEAAKLASSSAQKQNNKGKLHITNSINTAEDEDIYVKNMTIKKKNTQKQHWSSSSKTDLKCTFNMPSTITKNINTYESLPTYKGGGLMQRRLEAIKANKKLTKMPLKYDNTIEPTKFPNNQSNSHVSLSKCNVSKHCEYKSKLTVQKNLHSEIEPSDRTKIIANIPSKLK